MCHLILLTPLFALAVFWIWPLSVAATVYSVVTVLSLWMYYLVWQAMRRPVLGGVEELVHSLGEVVEVRGRSLRVRVHSELSGGDYRYRRTDPAGQTIRTCHEPGVVIECRPGNSAPMNVMMFTDSCAPHVGGVTNVHAIGDAVLPSLEHSPEIRT